MRFAQSIDLYIADMQAVGRINSEATVRNYRHTLDAHCEDVSNYDLVFSDRDDVKKTLPVPPASRTLSTRSVTPPSARLRTTSASPRWMSWRWRSGCSGSGSEQAFPLRTPIFRSRRRPESNWCKQRVGRLSHISRSPRSFSASGRRSVASRTRTLLMVDHAPAGGRVDAEVLIVETDGRTIVLDLPGGDRIAVDANELTAACLAAGDLRRAAA